MKKIIQINGMKCEHCTSRVEEALKKIANVKSVKVNLAKRKPSFMVMWRIVF